MILLDLQKRYVVEKWVLSAHEKIWWRTFYYRYLTVSLNTFKFRLEWIKWRYDGLTRRNIKLGWLWIHIGKDKGVDTYPEIT